MYTLGLDIGGTYIKAIALGPDHELRAEHRVPSRANESPEAVRTAAGEVVRHFQGLGLRFNYIGVGCAGSIDPALGTVRNSPNFANWYDIPLREWLEKDFGVPAWIENDANCAAYTEWKLGAGKGYRNMVLLTLGTGVGGGLILDNRLFRGATGTAGELGHFGIHASGIPCPCGHQGCFERYCSASALKMRVPELSARQVFEGAPDDPRLQKEVDTLLKDFQNALVSLANIFDPEVMVLGGALSQGLSPYLEGIRDWVAAHAFPAVGKNMKILMAKYANLSGALGAALIALDEHTVSAIDSDSPRALRFRSHRSQ